MKMNTFYCLIIIKDKMYNLSRLKLWTNYFVNNSFEDTEDFKLFYDYVADTIVKVEDIPIVYEQCIRYDVDDIKKKCLIIQATHNDFVWFSSKVRLDTPNFYKSMIEYPKNNDQKSELLHVLLKYSIDLSGLSVEEKEKLYCLHCAINSFYIDTLLKTGTYEFLKICIQVERDTICHKYLEVSGTYIPQTDLWYSISILKSRLDLIEDKFNIKL